MTPESKRTKAHRKPRVLVIDGSAEALAPFAPTRGGTDPATVAANGAA